MAGILSAMVGGTFGLPPATYAVAAAGGATSVNEGSSLTFNVTGTNIVNGTYYWTVSATSDFATSSGSFTITSNAGSFSVTPTADTTTEGAETFTASVRTGSTSGTIVATSSSITINDTSIAGPQNSVTFDGTGDYYEATVASSSGAADSQYTTIVGWIKPGSNSPMNLLQIQLGTASGNPGINFCIWDNGTHLLRQPDNSGSDNSDVYGTYALGANVWQHFMLYVDWTNFDNCEYYVNGVRRTTTHLLNGPSFGERGVDGQLMNWTSATQVKVNIGSFFAFNGARDTNDYQGEIGYLWVGSQAGCPDIGNFWDSAASKPWALASNGAVNGYTPRIYHYGNTSTFATNNASAAFAAYTATAFGNVATGVGQAYSTNSFSAPSTGTVSFVASATTTTGTTITIPASAQDGDIAILFEYAGSGTETVATGWTPLRTSGQGVTGVRGVQSMRILSSAYAGGTTVTNTFSSSKIILIFRPSRPITFANMISIGGLAATNSTPTTVGPSTPTLADGSFGNFPIIVYWQYASNGPITTRGWSGSTPTEVSASTGHYVKYLTYNPGTSPTATTFSMNDAGSNLFGGDYIRLR